LNFRCDLWEIYLVGDGGEAHHLLGSSQKRTTTQQHRRQQAAFLRLSAQQWDAAASGHFRGSETQGQIGAVGVGGQGLEGHVRKYVTTLCACLLGGKLQGHQGGIPLRYWNSTSDLHGVVRFRVECVGACGRSSLQEWHDQTHSERQSSLAQQQAHRR
jgi:hypothetical protein